MVAIPGIACMVFMMLHDPYGSVRPYGLVAMSLHGELFRLVLVMGLVLAKAIDHGPLTGDDGFGKTSSQFPHTAC